MASIDQATLEELDKRIEVDLLTPRKDGSTSSRPVWVVVVDGKAYLRSYRGEQGAWYRRARADGRAAFDIDGQTVEFAVEPEPDDALNERISQAFQAKYGERSPGPTEAMVSPEVTATTLRLT